MKKILCICTKTIEDWDIFTSFSGEDSTKSTISLLLLHQDQHLENLPVFQVWNLDRGDQPEGELVAQKSIIYQEFLEEIFFHDQSVVI